MFDASEWAHTVLEVRELEKQTFPSIKKNIPHFIVGCIVNMHRLSDVLCFSKHH